MKVDGSAGKASSTYIDASRLFLYKTTRNLLGTSVNQAAGSEEISYSSRKDKIMGGHAIRATGYDDGKVIVNADDSKSSKGALLVRKSWGEILERKGLRMAAL